MINRTDLIILIVIMICVFLIAVIKPVRPAMFGSDAIAQFDNDRVRVYKVEDIQPGYHHNVCYVVVGELHGRTVAIDCVGRLN